MTNRATMFVLLCISCAGEPEPLKQANSDIHTEVNGPVALDVECDVFTPGALTAPSLQGHELLACLDAADQRLTNKSPEMYDSCQGKVWLPLACELPFGQQICAGGRWTAICADDKDCSIGRCYWVDGVGTKPISTLFGTCERTCATDLDCVRCDLECDPKLGICREKVTVPPRQ